MNWPSVFGFKQDQLLQDFSVLGTDLHSHLIPGLDDGASSLEDSLEMIQGLYDYGYRRLITTPHVMSGFAENSSAQIIEGLNKLQAAVNQAGIDVVLRSGAEYMVSDEFETLLKSGDLLTFCGKHILLELSTFAPHPNFRSVLFDLNVAGYTVILAHVERYGYWFHNMNVFEELQAGGVLLQVNTLSFTSYYSGTIRKHAELLADAGMIDFLGTDLHHCISLPYFKDALNKKAVQKLLASGKLKNSSL